MNLRDESFDSAVNILSPLLKSKLMSLNCIIKSDTYEIRLRAGKPVLLFGKYGYMFLRKNGETSSRNVDDAYICNTEIITEAFNRLCCYSVYSHIESLVNGYITFQGGHRAGITGTAVLNNDEKITSLKDISSINIRIARQITGSADKIFESIGYENYSIIIAGPPSSGKTTVLRDYVRQISDRMKKVCVIDERQEIAAMNAGFCQRDVGINTDVLDLFPKDKAVENAVRTMAPDIIAMDELCSDKEIDAISLAVNSGVRFIVTVHASDYSELLTRPQIHRLLKAYSFERLVLLCKDRPGQIEGIYDTKELLDEIIGRNIGLGKCVTCGDELTLSA